MRLHVSGLQLREFSIAAALIETWASQQTALDLGA